MTRIELQRMNFGNDKSGVNDDKSFGAITKLHSYCEVEINKG